MNENFIEEDNTVYEIDPDCQIVSLERDSSRRPKRQSCEEEWRVPERRGRNRNGCCFPILFLLLCLGKKEC